MRTILISILTPHNIPNVLLAREFETECNEHVFITTQRSQKFLNGVTKAFKTSKPIRELFLQNEDDLLQVKQKLEQALPNTNDTRYIVNLTGGSKIMALGIYQHFALGDNQVYYIPIDMTNYYCIYPSNETKPLIHQLGVADYLNAYNIRCEYDQTFLKSKETTLTFFETYKKKQFNRKKEPYIIKSQELPNTEDRTYYSGKWFEEFIYHKLSDELLLKPNQIAISAKLFHEKEAQPLIEPEQISHDNEYDILFVKKNRLYVVECKQSISQKEAIDAYMYKLVAITSEFGLSMSKFLVTLSSLHSFPFNYDHICKRSKLLNINLLEKDAFLNNQWIKRIK